ncbi:MAG: transposase [Tetrasphaera sp.]|nr:transposase [Tetrasphaera sp.]
MAAPKKYSDELRERATRMAVELRQDPATRPGAISRVAGQLGMHPETLRNWVRQAEVDGGTRAGTTTSDAQRLVELERENRELRRANHHGGFKRWAQRTLRASLMVSDNPASCGGVR